MKDVLKSGTVQVLPGQEFEKKLAQKKPLRIKLGLDPTAPDLHLGHALVLQKLKQFQQAGHTVVFLIGDFTARIGDPSGKSKTRPPLSTEQIELNAKTYFAQVNKILDPKNTEIRYNSEWLSKIDLAEWIKIAAKVTLARIIERDDFAKRLQDNIAIGFHELFYPLLQGYDSVVLKADVELGGTDQTFNLLMGRHLQEEFDQEPQVIMTMPLLVGLDGVQKMSKSIGNHIGLTEEPGNAFGKVMSISDELMWNYYELLLETSDEEIEQMRQKVEQEKVNPMDLKKALAAGIIKKYWSETEARSAQQNFESIFQKQDYSKAQEVSLSIDAGTSLWIVDLLKQLGAIKTSSEAKRLLQDGAVSIDGQVIKDFKSEITCESGMIIKVGKYRIYKIK
jgi:tyrosyl-tRNA synthetase